MYLFALQIDPEALQQHYDREKANFAIFFINILIKVPKDTSTFVLLRSCHRSQVSCEGGSCGIMLFGTLGAGDWPFIRLVDSCVAAETHRRYPVAALLRFQAPAR